MILFLFSIGGLCYFALALFVYVMVVSGSEKMPIEDVKKEKFYVKIICNILIALIALMFASSIVTFFMWIFENIK